MPLQRRIAVVAYNDGRVEKYPVTPKVEINFETVYKVGMSNAFNGNNGNTRLYQLAWEAMRAAKPSEVVTTVEKWVEEVAALDIETEDVRPLAAAAPTTE